MRSAKATVELPDKCYCSQRLKLSTSRHAPQGTQLQHSLRLRRCCHPCLLWVRGPGEWLPVLQQFECTALYEDPEHFDEGDEGMDIY